MFLKLLVARIEEHYKLTHVIQVKQAFKDEQCAILSGQG